MISLFLNCPLSHTVMKLLQLEIFPFQQLCNNKVPICFRHFCYQSLGQQFYYLHYLIYSFSIAHVYKVLYKLYLQSSVLRSIDNEFQVCLRSKFHQHVSNFYANVIQGSTCSFYQLFHFRLIFLLSVLHVSIFL